MGLALTGEWGGGRGASILISAGFCCQLWWAELAATLSPIAHLSLGSGCLWVAFATLKHQSPRRPAGLGAGPHGSMGCAHLQVSLLFFFPVSSELVTVAKH